MIKRQIIIFQIAFLVCLGVCAVKVYKAFAAPVYYFSTSGNDTTGDGSQEKPWQTTNKLNDVAAAGVVDGTQFLFKRGDTWSNQEAIGRNVDWGDNKTITIGDYGPGNKPTFNGDTMASFDLDDDNGADGSNVSFVINNIKTIGMNSDAAGGYNIRFTALYDLTLNGCEWDGHAGPNSAPDINGFGIFRIERYLEIKYGDFANCYDKSSGISGTTDHTMFYITYKADGGSRTTVLKIHHNTFVGATSDLFQLKGINRVGGQHSYFADNKFYLYGENAIDFKNCGGFDIYNNDFSRNWTTGQDQKAGSGGFGSDITCHTHKSNYGATCNNLHIYDNTFHDSYRNAVAFTQGHNCSMYRNTIINVAQMVYISDFDTLYIHNNRYDNTAGNPNNTGNPMIVRFYYNEVADVKFYQNSIYTAANNNTRGLSIEMDPGHSGIEIKGNVIVTEDNGITPIYVYNRNGVSLPTIDHNAIYTTATNFVYWNRVGYTSEQQSSWTDDGHIGGLFLTGNPFTDVNTYNLTPVEGSSFIDAWAGPGDAYKYAIIHDQSVPFPTEGSPVTTYADQGLYCEAGKAATPYEYGAVIAGTSGGGSDTAAPTPILESITPTEQLDASTTQVTVGFAMSEPCDCEHSLIDGFTYGTGTEYSTFDNINFSFLQTGLHPGDGFNIYNLCQDAANNISAQFAIPMAVAPTDNLLTGLTIANGGIHSHSGNYDSGLPVEGLNDQCIGTGACSAGGLAQSAWVIYDLGKETPLGLTRVHGDDTKNWWCYTWTMEGSNNLSDWTTLVNAEDCYGWGWFPRSLNNVTYRYIRYTLVGNNAYDVTGAFQVVEIELYRGEDALYPPSGFRIVGQQNHASRWHTSIEPPE